MTDHTPSPATDGLREAVEALAVEFHAEARRHCADESDVYETTTLDRVARRLRAVLAAHPALPPSETATEPYCSPERRAEGWMCPAPCMTCPPPVSSDEVRADEGDDDGPECETCGKTTCPDADLAAFSEPVSCAYKPIFDALRDAKDCDYGCGRDLTNQEVRLYVVPAVENILAALDRARGLDSAS